MSSLGFYFDMSKIVEDRAKTEQFEKDRASMDKYLREMRAVYNRNDSWLHHGITDNIPEVFR